jgi:hypothetical protein
MEGDAMGTKEAISFSQFNAERESQFISYREALEKLSVEAGESFAGVAKALKLSRIHKRYAVSLAGPERAPYRDAEGESLAALLDHTIKNNMIEGVSYEGKNAEPDTCGWIRLELMILLGSSKLPAPESIAMPRSSSPLEPDRSREYFQDLESITAGVAARILAGVSPYVDAHDLPNEDVQKVAPFGKILCAAVSSNQLAHLGDPEDWLANSSSKECAETSNDTAPSPSDLRNTLRRYDNLKLSHADIRAWCQANGFHWPFPAVSGIRAGEVARHDATRTDDEGKCPTVGSEEPLLRVQIAEMQKTIDELRRIVGDRSAIALHNTRLMKIALQIQREYWGDPIVNPRPNQEYLWGELQEKFGLNEKQAKAVELVACPIDRNRASKN